MHGVMFASSQGIFFDDEIYAQNDIKEFSRADVLDNTWNANLQPEHGCGLYNEGNTYASFLAFEEPTATCLKPARVSTAPADSRTFAQVLPECCGAMPSGHADAAKFHELEAQPHGQVQSGGPRQRLVPDV
jgi:hypothetical protein